MTPDAITDFPPAAVAHHKQSLAFSVEHPMFDFEVFRERMIDVYRAVHGFEDDLKQLACLTDVVCPREWRALTDKYCGRVLAEFLD